MSNLPKVLVICGPTGSGKTAVALHLAEQIPAEIISADSRQVYRRLDIGTAKPDHTILERIPHHCIDICDPREQFTAGDFEAIGKGIALSISERGRIPIVVGGTGLYIQALIDGIFKGPGRDATLRQKLEKRYQMEGGEVLLTELFEVDPGTAQRIRPSNSRRLIRALEVYLATGIPLSVHHERQQREQWCVPHFIALDWERKKLYQRINDRVLSMLNSGLLDEVRSLMIDGYTGNEPGLFTVGYQEVFLHLKGKISAEEMTAMIQQNSRRYAKRQLTWFRRDHRIRWYSIDDERDIPAISRNVLNFLR